MRDNDMTGLKGSTLIRWTVFSPVVVLVESPMQHVTNIPAPLEATTLWYTYVNGTPWSTDFIRA